MIGFLRLERSLRDLNRTKNKQERGIFLTEFQNFAAD